MGVRATEIRKGQVIQLNGDLLLVTEFEHKTPGNLRAIINIKTRSLTTGATAAECARILRAAGAARVGVLAVARVL